MWLHDVTSRCHKITTDDTIQEQHFVWERGTSVGVDFGLFNPQEFLHAEKAFKILKKKEKGRGKKAG